MLACGLRRQAAVAPRRTARRAQPELRLLPDRRSGLEGPGLLRQHVLRDAEHRPARSARGCGFTNAYAACPVCSPTRASIIDGQVSGPAGHHAVDRRAQRADAVPALPAPGGSNHRRGPEGGRLRDRLRRQVAPVHTRAKTGSSTIPTAKVSTSISAGTGPVRRRPISIPTRNATGQLETMPPGGERRRVPDRPIDGRIAQVPQRQQRQAVSIVSLALCGAHAASNRKPALTEKYKAKAEGLLPTPEPARTRSQFMGVTRREWSRTIAVYAGMVQSVDESVGRVMNKLEALGLEAQYDRDLHVRQRWTVHRWLAKDRPAIGLLRAGKGWLYEGGIREPMLIKWPGVVKPGSLCHEHQ